MVKSSPESVRPAPDSPSADEALRRSEERYRLMVSSVRDYAIFMLDPAGRVESWNAGAEAIKGYKADEILGHHISFFYTPEDLAADKPKRLLHLAAQDGRVEDEGWRVRKDGTRFWADVVITALYDAAGKLQRYAKVTRDLTARRDAEEALRQTESRFRLLVQSAKDHAIFMLDREGRVTTWNTGASRIKGYSPEEIIGQHFSLFYSPEEVASGKCERELEVAAVTGKFEEEGWRFRKNGTRFWASVIIEPIRDNDDQLIGFVKVVRDLTEKRNAEAERIRLAQAQEAIRLRDEFLSIASHELKTPLTALQLQLQSVHEKVKALDEQAAARLERATRSGARLADVIEALLDVTRIATGRFELNPTAFDLSEAVGEVLERLRGNAAQAGCELRARLEPGVIGTWDRMRLEQVVTNLLANSFKYGAGGPVEISLKSDGAQAELMVCDSGPGIPEKDLARIFERFERAVSMRNYGGMGLGLYVTRQIVDAHGGTVEAHNRPAGGAVFIARVPLMPAHRPKSEQRHK